MAKTEMKKVGFNLPTETIDKLEETLRLRNEQLKVTGSSMTKQELVNEIINEAYYRIQGTTKDADTVNKINTLIDDRVDEKFDSSVINTLKEIHIDNVRTREYVKALIRMTAGTYDEQIKKRMKDYGISKEQATEQYNNWLSNELFQPCAVVEAIDAELFDDGSDPIDE